MAILFMRSTSPLAVTYFYAESEENRIGGNPE